MVRWSMGSARRAKYLAFGLLAALLALPVHAQGEVEPSLQTFAAVDAAKSGTTFQVRGLTDLPDHTRLLSVIWYAGRPIYRSWRRAEVDSGRFQIQVGPIRETVLAGTYEIVVQFARADQPAQLRRELKRVRERAEVRTSVYVGNATQEAEEDTLYRTFLPETTRRLEAAFTEIAKAYDAGMDPDARRAKADLVAWAEATEVSLREQRRALHDHDETCMFASRYPDMIQDLSVILSMLELIFHSYAQDLCKRHGVTEGLPDLLRAEPVFRIVPSEVRQEIERRFRELARRDRSSESVTAFDLYQDLLQLNELRLQVGRGYQVQKQELNQEEWENWHASWLQRLRHARAGAARYADGALPAKLAIDVELAALVDDLERLGWVYFGSLYAAQKIPLPEQAPRVPDEPEAQDEKIRTRWRALFEVVQGERKRLHDALRGLFEKATAEAPRIQDQRSRLEKAKIDLAQWAAEAETSQARLGEARAGLERLRQEPLLERFFPAVAGKIGTCLDCLSRILIEVTGASNGGAGATIHGERLRYLDRVLRQLQEGVEKDLNRKDELIQ